MKHDAVVFDLDGTLLNTLPDIALAVNRVIEPIGMAEVGEELIRRSVGSGVEALLRRIGVPEVWNAPLADQLESIYAGAGNSLATVYPGVKEMVEGSAAAGLFVCLLSNKPHRGVLRAVENHFRDLPIEAVAGSGPNGPAKPSPETLLKMLSARNIPPEKAVMVGDGEADILAAREAGTVHLGVLWGYRSRKFLREAGALNFAETPDEALDFILGRVSAP